MEVEIKIPTIGESISEVTISVLLVQDGDYVTLDQPLCEMESDKATLELPAEKAGIITWLVAEGDDINIGDAVCKIDTSAKAPESKKESVTEVKKEVVPVEEKKAALAVSPNANGKETYAKGVPSPAASKLMSENGISNGQINGTGKDGRITKQDVINAIKNGLPAQSAIASTRSFSREKSEKKLSRLRQTIGKRLLAAKHGTAMLTTFNEVDMGPIKDLRVLYKEKFREKHGVNLGFMSFFTKAICNALMDFPAVNAYIKDEFVEYHDYCDISIAVSTPKGLVVPVIRNAESLSMDGIEKTIKTLAIKGRDGELTMEDMEGGTFTISNGGVFGSLMSTPILNPPQSAILGMHKIEDRPMAVNGEIVVRPMMYLALSYDHRIIDGKESVSFLVRVKEQLENPQHLLFGTDPVKLLLDL